MAFYDNSFNSSMESDISIFELLNETIESLEELNTATEILIEKEGHLAMNFIDKTIIFYLRHNLSLVGLEDLMDLLNVHRELCEKLPTHKKQILRLFREGKDVIKVIYFVKCAKCGKITEIDSENMDKVKCCDIVLKKSETNFFVHMPLHKQITESLITNWKDIQSFDTTSKDGIISDAHDGNLLKNLLKVYEKDDINILSLCLNVDGANKFNSNLISLWPVQFSQNYLPPQMRFLPDNILVSGLLYTEGSFDFREYFLPVINEMDSFKTNHIVLCIDDKEYKFKPVITHCAVDLPAKSKIQETKQFGGYNACTYCHIPGEQVLITCKAKGKGTKKNPKGNDPKQKKCVRYPERDVAYPLRDEKETLRNMLIASSSADTSVDGVKDISCLVGLEHFNIVKSLSVEYMHCILLGNIKRMIQFFCDSKNSKEKYYITMQNRRILNKKILALKPNREVVRKPRSLDHLSLFKASEFRYMLLFYLPVCLVGCLPDVYVKHVRLLSAATYILLKSSITYEEIDEAEQMFNRFVIQHQKLFGVENMVMNVHMLKHSTDSVRELGPLWCHSAFPFERNNGVLLKKVNGTRHVLMQISSKYTLSKAVVVRSNKRKSNDKDLLGRSITILEKSLHAFNIESLKDVDLSNVPLHVHKRIILNNLVYTSTLYTLPKKSVDYVIGLHNDMIGKAKFYFESNDKKFVVMEEYEIIDNIDHIAKIQSTRRNILAPINEIKQKYLYMNVGLNQYISSLPNSYEKE